MNVDPIPQDGGSATCTVVGSGSAPEGASWTGSWTSYRLDASPSDEWAFVRFEWDWVQNGHSSFPASGTNSSESNPCQDSYVPILQPGSLTDYDASYPDGRVFHHRVTAVRAYFRDTLGRLIIKVSTAPNDADARCTADIDGTHQIDERGTPGERRTFTLTASCPEGWKFCRWVFNGSTAWKRTKEVESFIAFPPSGTTRTYEYKAWFCEDTGEIMYDPDNADDGIIYGKDGSIIYKC